MTFVTEAQKSASERFFLVQITPRLALDPGTLVAVNTYEFPLDDSYIVEQVLIDEVEETNWTHANNVLTITSALALDTPAFNVTVDHNLFITGTSVRETSGIAGIPDATWMPLIDRYPEFSQSMRNITEGVFSLSNTEISLICTDRWAQSLLGLNHSFSNAPVKVWACINDASTNRKIFDGDVTEVNYSYGKLTISVIDTFNKLKQTGMFGTYANSHLYTSSPLCSFPDADRINSAAPIVIGKTSPMTVNYGNHPEPVGQPFNVQASYFLQGGLPLVLNSPKNYTDTSTATFFVGRFIGTDLRKMTFGTVTRCYMEIVPGTNVGGIKPFVRMYHVQCSNFSGAEVGDVLPSGLPGVTGSRQWIITNKDHIGPDGQTYQFATTEQNFLFVSATAPSNALVANPTLPDNTYPSYSVFRSSINGINWEIDSGVSIQSKDCLYYINGFNGTVTPIVTSLGTYAGQPISALYIQIIYPPPYMTSFFRMNEIPHNTMRCRFSPNQTMSHGDTLKFIVESAGLTANAASFTQADIDLVANVATVFPQDGASQFSSYLENAQDVTSSTLGLLRVNQDREIEYELIKAPDSLATDSTKTSLNMLIGDTSTSVQYQDIVTTVKFENPNYKNINELIPGTNPNAVATMTDFYAKQLHRVDKTKTISHVLDNILDRKDAFAGYFANPTVEYSLATASEDLATSIGDVVEITNTAVASESETVKGLVVGLDQSGSKTSVKINEIRGV